MPMPSRVASSISMNSIGTRRMVISDSVTTAAASRLIASIGSSDGGYSTSRSMSAHAVDRQRRRADAVDPHPELSRKKQRSWTM